MRNNCEAFDKTQKCFESKHKICVLQNTCVYSKKTHLCFQSVGPVCGMHFWMDTNFLKNKIGLFNISDFEKIWNRAKTFF